MNMRAVVAAVVPRCGNNEAVDSVAGKTGDVVLVPADITGLEADYWHQVDGQTHVVMPLVDLDVTPQPDPALLIEMPAELAGSNLQIPFSFQLSAFGSVQNGSNNTQSGYNNIQSGSGNSQSGYNNIQSGSGNTQSSAYNSVQSGYSNTQSGSYSTQSGSYLDDDGFDSTAMFGSSKTATVGSRAYFALSNGVWLQPVATAPASPENGVIYYDSALHKFRGYANGAWVDFH